MRLWLSVAFFTAYIAVQLTVPAVQALSGRQPFRWGMFAYSKDRQEVVAEYPGGSRETLAQIHARTGRARLFRSEIDKGKTLPPYLCSLSPAPSHVLFRNLRTGEEKRYPCR